MNDAHFPQNLPKEEGYYWALSVYSTISGKSYAWQVVHFDPKHRGIVKVTGCDDWYSLDRNDIFVKRWGLKLQPPTEEDQMTPLQKIEYSNTSIEGVKDLINVGRKDDG